jgi:hypothetical protein
MRHLYFERLETRTPPSVASFHFDLYEDADGTRGELIADDAVEAGDAFFVSIMARELDPARAGLGGVSLDISWDPDAFQEIDTDIRATITPNLPVIRTGALDNTNGRITDLGGSALVSIGTGRPIGNLKPEQFALLHFHALESAGETSITMRQGQSSIATVPVSSLSAKDLEFEVQSVTVESQPIVGPLEYWEAEADCEPLYDSIVSWRLATEMEIGGSDVGDD